MKGLVVLNILGERLSAANIPFMLTSSFAMAYYAKPRMTRDLDLFLALVENDIKRVVDILVPYFTIITSFYHYSLFNRPEN